jgi:hypothetical protein
MGVVGILYEEIDLYVIEGEGMVNEKRVIRARCVSEKWF